MIRMGLAIGLVALPAPAVAQAYRCALPTELPRPRPDGPTQSQPKRDIPIGSYTLAISWQPQRCRNAGRDDRLAATAAIASDLRCTGCGPTERGAIGRNIAAPPHCFRNP
jgi:ribonuclease T2